MKNFARSIPEETHRRERFVTCHEDLFDCAPDNRTDEQECLAAAEQASQSGQSSAGLLRHREREILRMRAGLDGGNPAMTLEKIGEKIGITKERVRQLNLRIMKKLKDIARDQHMDL